MQIVYWSHSYRNEDAGINQYFGVLIEQAARMIVNFDPPSNTVNAAKLEQNMRSCDGMVAVLTWRATGPSKYILYEIGLCLRARKPLLVFVDDRLADDIIPPRILQRRYSHRTYFRQVREHTQALHALKTYMGDPPPPRYQPGVGQRTCGVVGLRGLSSGGDDSARRFIGERGYRLIDLEAVDYGNPLVFQGFEHLAGLDVAVNCVDSTAWPCQYWAGALSTAFIPAITITANTEYPFSDQFPNEFQPRLASGGAGEVLEPILQTEFDLYEQDFLKVEDPESIERYVSMQVEAGALEGRYEANTRRQFTEVIMGDQYNVSGQTGAVGRKAHAHGMTFSQVWNQSNIDLARLAEELGRLRLAMEREATEPSHKLASGAVAAAEQSAKENNGPKVLEYLKTAGRWALTVAEKIGTDLAKEALKKTMGM
jgi:hypothetical protein